MDVFYGPRWLGRDKNKGPPGSYAGRSYAGRDGAAALQQVGCDGTLHLRIERMLGLVRSGALSRDLSAVFTLPSFRAPPQPRIN